MIKKLFHTLLLRRHFWRYASFSEMAEMYTARMLRMAAIHIAGSFIAIYLFQIGYSIAQIAFFWAAFYLFKVGIALPGAALVARIGPKHAIFLSNLMYIPAMIGFAFLPAVGPLLLIPILVFEASSACLYSIAHNINFSKIKSLKHAGKEIGYMYMVERITTGLSPLIGGVIAFLFGPQVVIIVAALLFACAAGPLMRTVEQVKTGQALHFKGFPWRLLFRHGVAQTSYGFDVFSSGSVWSLFIALVVVGMGSSNEIYVISGMLLSVVFVVSLITSYLFGKLIDNSQGARLMRISIVMNAAMYCIRPVTSTPLAAAGVNAANELATTGFAMPYLRGVYDNADLSGRRTTYLGLCEMLSNLGAAFAAMALGFLALALGDEMALKNYFFIAAGVALLMITARFPLYKKP